ncbi:fructosamine kinase family protein [Luteibaculum oceani]|uniref:Fructosamine kinase family protein n=1 Tax=Luteibaculum oceani TaxID=1294296 RepID=A0A5C6UZ50_9FLAO|nr:fructosamine kinase family protein [Luteibaculum oceani]TXC78537.1 fructosamine kinase family protein [Luteibaculum oceani]
MQELLQQILKNNGLGSVENIQFVGGGSINNAFKVSTNRGNYFIKLNENTPGDFFAKEADGLQALSQVVRVPQVIAVGKAYLILEYLNIQALNKSSQKKAGEQLAILHSIQSNFFGWEHHNYMGSVQQLNDRVESGAKFLQEYRLKPLFEKCKNQGLISQNDLKLAERLIGKLEGILPSESPTLIHGDLWSGNIGCHNEEVYFYDPAVQYGYREMDLAMTQLFGGFDQEFYDAYLYNQPLDANWQERVPLFQLYPLLIHLLLFGSGYYRKVMRVISAYV